MFSDDRATPLFPPAVYLQHKTLRTCHYLFEPSIAFLPISRASSSSIGLGFAGGLLPLVFALVFSGSYGNLITSPRCCACGRLQRMLPYSCLELELVREAEALLKLVRTRRNKVQRSLELVNV
jgi:hypothetical protein